ncbi:peptidoglycan editing factor PgeF [Caloramator sp. E03]|uniref:peptidoglycan editing factor PgeF n=1 Tax=Caloramator sp. E03 TaxID=2576307 RepID=UPI00143D4CEC|nr:peptidoglycan editing factor PgeF [Caloramator sp. E03]
MKKHEGLEFICSPKLEKIKNVRHFFSTKIDEGNKDFSLNAFNIYEKEKININYKRIFKAANMNFKYVYLKQVHGSNFYVVDEKNYEYVVGKEGDGLITSLKNVAVGVLTADCVPVLVCDYINNTIAAIHAGWRGTDKEITYKVIDYMIKKMGCSKDSMIVAIGPSIGPCCFEVGFDVAIKFKYNYKDNEKYYVDLWNENIKQILACGIDKTQIDLLSLCTACNRDMFYSYRKENGTRGRLGAFIQLI